MSKIDQISERYTLDSYEDTDWKYYLNKTPMFTFSNFVKEFGDNLLLVVIRGDYIDKDLENFLNSISALAQSFNEDFSCQELQETVFDNILICNYKCHEYFKNISESLNEQTLVCFPAYKCEFTGDESIKEFNTLRKYFVTTIDWNREPSPKIRMKYHNYTSKSKMSKFGLVSWQDVVNEMTSMCGGNSGYIELKNYKDDLLKIRAENNEVSVDGKRYSESSLKELVNAFLIN